MRDGILLYSRHAVVLHNFNLQVCGLPPSTITMPTPASASAASSLSSGAAPSKRRAAARPYAVADFLFDAVAFFVHLPSFVMSFALAPAISKAFSEKIAVAITEVPPLPLRARPVRSARMHHAHAHAHARTVVYAFDEVTPCYCHSGGFTISPSLGGPGGSCDLFCCFVR